MRRMSRTCQPSAVNGWGVKPSTFWILSGAPLQKKSTAIIRHIAQKTRIPIIGCGGIFDIGSAREKIEAGAKLLQVYTGFIYRGPNLIRELATL